VLRRCRIRVPDRRINEEMSKGMEHVLGCAAVGFEVLTDVAVRDRPGQWGYGKVLPALFRRTTDCTNVVTTLWQIMTACGELRIREGRVDIRPRASVGFGAASHYPETVEVYRGEDCIPGKVVSGRMSGYSGGNTYVSPRRASTSETGVPIDTHPRVSTRAWGRNTQQGMAVEPTCWRTSPFFYQRRPKSRPSRPMGSERHGRAATPVGLPLRKGEISP
jgi:hypothetical protein